MNPLLSTIVLDLLRIAAALSCLWGLVFVIVFVAAIAHHRWSLDERAKLSQGWACSLSSSLVPSSLHDEEEGIPHELA